MSLALDVVITRDRFNAERSAAYISQNYPWNAIIAPVRAIEVVDHAPLELSKYTRLIVTSGTVFRFVDLSSFRGEVLCVGGRAAHVFERIQGVKFQSFESASALKTAFETLPPQPTVYVSGAPTSVEFDCDLLDVFYIYQAQHRDWDLDEIAQICAAKNAIFPVFSSESAHSLLKNLDKLPLRQTMIAAPISSKVATILAQDKRLICSPPPQTPSFIALCETINANHQI